MNRYYEPRLKVKVPSNPPKYLVKTFECYTKKMKEKKAIGLFICEDFNAFGCKADGICRLFAELTLLTLDVIKERGLLKV